MINYLIDSELILWLCLFAVVAMIVSGWFRSIAKQNEENRRRRELMQCRARMRFNAKAKSVDWENEL